MARKGQGSLYRPMYTDRHGEKKASKVWWISYPDGKGGQRRESTKRTVKKEAQAILNQRLANPETAEPPATVTFDALIQLVLDDYRANGQKSLPSTWHPLAAFGGKQAASIRNADIVRYRGDRLEAGAAPATVNRELAVIRRAFRLGKDSDMVRDIPSIKMLKEQNVREGFLEPEEFERLRECLPDYLRPLADVAYLTGWRKGELLSRCWRHVDFEAGWIRLEPGETKNGKGRQFPLIPPLRAVLEEQRRRKLEVEKRTGRIIDPVFFYPDGKPIRYFRVAWANAIKDAGLPGLLFHDLRRTAARNMLRSGLSEHEAMKFTGHETAHIFRRYAIADEVTLNESGAKYSAFVERRTAQLSKTHQRRA